MMPKIDRIDHIHVFVSDRVAAEHWYERVLGFRRVPELEFWAVNMAVSGESFTHWQAHLQNVLEKPIHPVDHRVAQSLYFTDPDGNPYEITTYIHE